MFPLAALLDVGTKLIDKLIPDPEAKAKAQLDLLWVKKRKSKDIMELLTDVKEKK